MGAGDAQRWDDRYQSGDYRPRTHPSPLVDGALRYIAPGRALVLACGTGRNAMRLAEGGFEVEAVDVSTVAIDVAREEAGRRGLEVQWRVEDIDRLHLGGGYDLITMIRYVNRDIWPRLIPALNSNGWLLIEQHLHTDRVVAGPGPDFRLAPGELLDAFPGLRVIEYFEAYQPSDRSDGMAATTGLLACKGDPGW